MNQTTRLFVLASATVFVVFVTTHLFTLSDEVEVSRFGRTLLENKPANNDDILGSGTEVFKEDLPTVQSGEKKTLHVTRTLLSLATDPKPVDKNVDSNVGGSTDKNAASLATNDEKIDLANDDESGIATSGKWYAGGSDESGFDDESSDAEGSGSDSGSAEKVTEGKGEEKVEAEKLHVAGSDDSGLDDESSDGERSGSDSGSNGSDAGKY